MKKLCFILSFIIICGCAHAQTDAAPAEQPPQKEQNIEALKVAFISKELNLNPEEAQKFWPVYNQYSAELHSTIKDDPNIIERDERVLNIRKRYNNDFIKILGPGRTNTMFGAESRFHQLLIKTMRNRQRMQQPNRPNRPLLRRG